MVVAVRDSSVPSAECRRRSAILAVSDLAAPILVTAALRHRIASAEDVPITVSPFIAKAFAKDIHC